tara:strand:+ start:220 stop:654 length:435 start_codon:yes stop_codon:yes gene_type:complete
MASKQRKTIPDFYLHYKWRHEPKSRHYQSKKMFTDVMTRFMELLSDHIMEGNTYKLPHRMGSIRVRKFKPTKKKAINWLLTKKFGKHIYHTNKHSGGMTGEWYWDKRGARLKNQTYYKMKATRENNRALSRKIKQENKINLYYE